MRRRLYSNPCPCPGVFAQLMKNPFAPCTFQIATAIVTTKASDTRGVRAPAINMSPPPNSTTPTSTASA